MRLFGVSQETGEPVMPAHEEIRGAVALHHIEGGMEREHRDMIGGILDLQELKVEDVMVHRKNVAMIDGGASQTELFEALLAANHTRVPVWKDTAENVIGVLNTKDVMREFVRRRGQMKDFDLLSLMVGALVRARHHDAGRAARRLPRAAHAFRAGGRRIRRHTGHRDARRHP